MPDHPLGIAYIGPEALTRDTLPQILSHLDSPPPKVAIDTETISLKDRTCIGIGLALSSKEAIYFRVLPETSPYLDHVTGVLCNPDILKIYHNALFDLGVLTIYGSIYEWPPIDLHNIADTSITARVQGMEASLAALTYQILGRDIPVYEAVVPPRHTSLDVPWSDIAHKCLLDCLATYDLYPHLY